MPDDYYVSKYSGEEIDALLRGAGEGTVRYDAAQALTDAQKTQARGNIGAAPSGYGYGEAINFTSWTDTDGSAFETFVDQMIDGTSKIVRLNGVADYPANVVSGNSGFADIKFNSDGYVLVLFHGPVNTLEGSNDGVYHASKKRLLNGAWLPWEYDNPPMQLGVEYRTTERYLGKPVYVQAVNFGTLPNAATKSVTWATSGVVLATLSVEATSNQGASLGLGASLSGTEITATTTTLYVKTSGDYSDNTAVFRVKYTKTTD